MAKSRSDLALWLGAVSVVLFQTYLAPFALSMANKELRLIDAGVLPESVRQTAVVARRFAIAGVILLVALVSVATVFVFLLFLTGDVNQTPL
jgi:hypothetical protein